MSTSYLVSPESASAQKWDVIVVGGGMVGAALALGLGQQNFKVLVLERQLPELSWDPETPYQTRVSALNRASENILKNLGAWAGFERRRYHPFTAMHVWDEITPAQVHFSAKDMGEPNLGYIVENRLVQAALWESMTELSNVSVLLDAQLNKLDLQSEQACLYLQDGNKLKADLIVAADGAMSQVRQLANIGLETHDYEQCAVVGCVKTELAHQDTCWQRYCKEGPFAFLSMADGVSSIAWYLPVDKMDWALSLSDEAFSAAVSEASGWKLGTVTEVAERVAFPLVRRHARHYVKSHLALVGDAAHTINPQAGQGVNLGFLDAAALIETLVEARMQNKPIGQFSVLRRYERWRRGDNALVQRSMEGFDWLFGQDASLKAPLRKAIIPIANQITSVKNWLMDQALYGREALPKLAKGTVANCEK